MQNIKVCPKCNQVSADSTKSFCPFDGVALVEMQPMQNQQPQGVFSQPQGTSYYHPTSQKKGMNLKSVGCLTVIALPIGIIFLCYGMNDFINYKSKTLSSNLSNVNNATNINSNISPSTTPQVSTSSNSGNVNKATNINSNISPSTTPQVSTTTIDKPSPAWKAGYKIGLKDGRDPENPPTFKPVHFNIMVKGAVGINKPKDPDNWEAGYREGFMKSYRGH